jgi:alpha-beta hydrolase superfamily lysophospholipase
MLLGGALACYAPFVLAATLFQNWLLYFPQTTSRTQAVQDAARLGLVLWPDEGGDFYGFVSADPPAVSKGTVLVWHGNSGTALHRRYYVRPLQDLGYQVVLLEYPGFGARSGRLGEASFVADALRAARQAEEDFGSPLYVWGESLGCGVASAVAAAPELEVRGAVMLTPWDRLPDLAQHHYWYLPAKWLTRDQYDNVQNLRAFSGPVAVLMADRDEVIPTAHAMRLYESLPGDKRLWVFESAGHSSWPTSPDEPWWAELMEWLSD